MLAIITSRGLRIAPSRSGPSGNKPAPCRHSRCSDPALTVPAVHLGGLTGKGFISDTHKGTTYPALSGTVLIYVCYPGIVINMACFLKRALVRTINYMVTLDL